ncbi:MAG: hypothetical protein KQH83_04645 [Actinobacteria bacterium]|nr:hypothetical protein [Actinomycetota bacterium]
MSRRKPVLAALLAVALSACGGGGLTDEGFAEEAAPICAAFADDLAASRADSALPTIFDHGPEYRTAHAGLAALDYTEASAPGGAALADAMLRAADAWDAFSAAIRPEIEAIDAPMMTFMFLESGGVVIVPNGNLAEMVEADIDESLLLTAQQAEAEVAEAAAGLSLDDCVPPAQG